MATEQKERDVIVTPSEPTTSAGMGIVLAVLVMLALGAIFFFANSGSQPPPSSIQHDTIVLPGNSGTSTPPTVPGEAPSSAPVTPPSVPGEPPATDSSSR